MSISVIEDDHLMVSYIDQRVAIDAVARLELENSLAVDELTLFPLGAHWADTPGRVIGYSVPPALPV